MAEDYEAVAHLDQAQELAVIVRARRIDLGRTQIDCATEAGLSEKRWRQIERGLNGLPRESNRAAICRALRWADNSVDMILAGEPPTELEPSTGPCTVPAAIEADDRLDPESRISLLGVYESLVSYVADHPERHA